MATRPQKQGRKVVHRDYFPYSKYEGTRLWTVIARAVDDLVENKDLTPTTHLRYIVGYLAKKVSTLPAVKLGRKNRP